MNGRVANLNFVFLRWITHIRTFHLGLAVDRKNDRETGSPRMKKAYGHSMAFNFLLFEARLSSKA